MVNLDFRTKMLIIFVSTLIIVISIGMIVCDQNWCNFFDTDALKADVQQGLELQHNVSGQLH